MAYIHYERKSNGVTYASLYESYRQDGKVKTRRIETLGKVIDREKGLFQSHGKMFLYSPELGRREWKEPSPREEDRILDFGDVWVLTEFLKNLPLGGCLFRLLPEETDTVMTLLLYHVLGAEKTGCPVRIWFEGSVVSLLYPHADLRDEHIREVLARLGDRNVQNAFFHDYLSALEQYKNSPLLVDSTIGEIRVITALDRDSGMPLGFWESKNLQDPKILGTAVTDLKREGLFPELVILDRGYFQKEQGEELMGLGIPFLTRLPPGSSLLWNAFRESRMERGGDHLISRDGKTLVVKKARRMLSGKEVYVYLSEEPESTALLSSLDLPAQEVFSLYEKRSEAVRILDLYGDKDVSSSYLLLSFLSSLLLHPFRMEWMKKENKLDCRGVLSCLRNQKCTCSSDKIIPRKPSGECSEIYSLLGISLPEEIPQLTGDEANGTTVTL